MNYKELRQKYPEFVYEKFDYKIEGNDLVVNFLFKTTPDLEFSPIIKIKDLPQNFSKTLSKDQLGNFIFHIGLAEVASYWKATCSPKIIIKAGFLDDSQLEYWHDLLTNGMGQFYYENKIDFTEKNFLTLSSLSDNKYSYVVGNDLSGVLIPVGGGKDSAVTLELLKEDIHLGAFMINPTKAAEDIVNVSGIKNKIYIERSLDPKLLELNKKGFLNGHTPFSSVVAFMSILSAYIFKYADVALSNEASSNEENAVYLGYKINHQYSKTYAFENKFRYYVKENIANINYFSFLRPIGEIQIAKIFSKYPKYFSLFRSCNIGQKNNIWCNNCSKCLSTYILLKPFLSDKDLKSIFKVDLINKPSLVETLSELIDSNKVKPFECVGTREELQIALKGNVKDMAKILTIWNKNNNLSEKYNRILKKYV